MKALTVIPNHDDCTLNIFSIEIKKINEVITKWKLRYPELRDELEGWKKRSRFAYETHETITLHHQDKKIECAFLKIYNSDEPGFLNCFSASKSLSKQSKSLKILNKVFKHKGEKIFNQLIKSNPKVVAALILSKDNNGLRILWK